MRLHDNRAWFLVLPAAAVMVFVGLVPLVTVLNFSLHDIFLLDQVHWVGMDWFAKIIPSSRFHASRLRSLAFSAIVLSVQIPLGIGVALLLARSGRVGLVMLLVAVPLAVPWNMIPVMWLNLVNPRTGLAGQAMVWLGSGFDYRFTALHT